MTGIEGGHRSRFPVAQRGRPVGPGSAALLALDGDETGIVVQPVGLPVAPVGIVAHAGTRYFPVSRRKQSRVNREGRRALVRGASG